jgi:signal peptidase I
MSETNEKMKRKPKKGQPAKLAPAQESAAPGTRPDFAEHVRSFIAEWTVTILLLVFGTATLLQAFVVPTSSMEDTVLIGDHMIVDKLAFSPHSAYARYLLPYTDVKRGDIIVFKYPVNPKENYVKRVIGVPGDRIHLSNRELYLNGRKMNEPYAVHKMPYPNEYRDNFPVAPPDGLVMERGMEMLQTDVQNGELVVPQGNYYAMGDNRDNSLDSRYWGLVPQENIVGKPVIVFWSYDASTEALTDPNFISLDHLLDIATHFVSKTRWRRTFLLMRGYPLG